MSTSVLRIDTTFLSRESRRVGRFQLNTIHRSLVPQLYLFSFSQTSPRLASNMVKRKRSVVAAESVPLNKTSSMPPANELGSRKRSTRQPLQPLQPPVVDANPDTNSEVLDGLQALRASPDAQAEENDDNTSPKTGTTTATSKRQASAASQARAKPIGQESKVGSTINMDEKPSGVFFDPEEEDLDQADEEEIKMALSRPPPVDSDYLPLPWKGRLGYACLNTYLRTANPPIFSSRTCRISSIIENRYPLSDPTQPPHPTKNRPDKTKTASIERGKRYVESIGLANARDIPKMLRWNDRYGIKFMRLSSEIFPFASHEEYGYKLEPFAAETLAEAGRVAAELGHRLTTHPGQFTQLGSPRKSVIDNSFRDLEYHAEMLSLLKLPEQQNRDAVMILHMGGIFGDKAATLDRFRENYQKLSQDVKNRLVLENDDMGWSVHDLLPICEELNIPMVLDYHHHNIVFDNTQIREGTLDIMDLYERITATWTRKGITQKMHYSEPTPAAITARQRRKHSPRVKTLPPCPPTMDLMIEAKDKEQAVFELMRVFKLPGWNTFNDITPHTRLDENKPWKPPKAPKKKKRADDVGDAIDEPEPLPPPTVPDEELNMGGPEGRVYWPPGMEEWLRPKKREIKKKEPSQKTPVAKKTTKVDPAIKTETDETESPAKPLSTLAGQAKAKKKPSAQVPVSITKKRTSNKSVPTPSTSDDELGDLSSLSDLDSVSDGPPAKSTKAAASVTNKALPRRQSGRKTTKAMPTYAEEVSDIE